MKKNAAPPLDLVWPVQARAIVESNQALLLVRTNASNHSLRPLTFAPPSSFLLPSHHRRHHHRLIISPATGLRRSRRPLQLFSNRAVTDEAPVAPSLRIRSPLHLAACCTAEACPFVIINQREGG